MVALTAADLTRHVGAGPRQEARRLMGTVVRGRDPRGRRRRRRPAPRGTEPVFVGRTTDRADRGDPPGRRTGTGAAAAAGAGRAAGPRLRARQRRAAVRAEHQRRADQPAAGARRTTSCRCRPPSPPPGQPPNIITRAQWGADESMKCGEPRVRQRGSRRRRAPHRGQQRLLAARTRRASSGRSTRTTPARSGWCDIAYNALVDKYGQVFEGRAGGIDQTGRGRAHRRLQREHLGRGDARRLRRRAADADPAAHDRTAVGLAARPRPRRPQGHRRADVRRAARSPTSRAARLATLPTIFTHRDVGITDCPGNAAYAAMDQIRDIAARFNDPPGPQDLADRCAAARSSPSGRRWAATNSPLGAPQVARRRPATARPATSRSTRARCTGRRRAAPSRSPARSTTRGQRWATSAARSGCRPAARSRNRSGSCRTSSTAR